jgi:putative membrane protein
VIVGIVLLVRYFGRSGQPATPAHTPEQLLAERFARGEIDES